MQRRGIRHRMTPFGEINVTPLIDVVMCLIIFYLMVGKLATDKRSEVKLPESRIGAESDPEVLVVNVATPRSGRGESGGARAWRQGAEVVVDGASIVDEDALEQIVKRRLAENPGTMVQIRAGEELMFSTVSPVMKACTRAGATSVRLAAERAGGGGR